MEISEARNVVWHDFSAFEMVFPREELIAARTSVNETIREDSTE